MFPIAHYIKGMVKNLFNPRISNFSFVSANNRIDPTVVVYRMAKIKGASIGRYSYIGNDTDVECADIGQFCSISDHCRIGMGGHTLNHLSTCPLFTQKAEANRALIGNDVCVGSHVLINGGVTVGNGAVIGAGAVVVKDVPPYAIVGGVPAKVIRYRFSPEIIQRLLELEWWNMDEKMLKENICFFQRDNISLDEVNAFVSNVVTKSSVR